VKILCHFFKCDFRVRVIKVTPGGVIHYAAEEGARGILTCSRCGKQKQVAPKSRWF
jgi:hypothetical protein